MATKPESTSPANDGNQPSKTTAATEDEFFPLSFFKNHKFQKPTKRISIPAHIGKFVTSPTYTKLIKFFNDLADAVKHKKLTDECTLSSTTTKFLSVLQTLNSLADDIEPSPIQSRYGNKSYRVWRDKVKQQSRSLITSMLPQSWTNTSAPQQQETSEEQKQKHVQTDDQQQQSETKEPETQPASTLIDSIVDELDGYFNEAFGDYTRIDYGTGHELTFLCFVLVLVELRVLRRSDYSAIVLRIFNEYILLMRKIQVRYALEPAGTRGSWGLDDYQFLTFYFGAAQLMEHPVITPKDILNKDVLKQSAGEYMYLSSIQFILEMKSGPFHEHSPLLNDITAVPLWAKVKSGLLKMYQDDVLKKLPVVQHFLFGSILTIDLPPIDKDAESGDSEKAEILKRKQALIAKLNAKNPKFTAKSDGDGGNRNGQQGQAPMVMTAAPWAQGGNSNASKDNSDLPVTKAPWAK